MILPFMTDNCCALSSPVLLFSPYFFLLRSWIGGDLQYYAVHLLRRNVRFFLFSGEHDQMFSTSVISVVAFGDEPLPVVLYCNQFQVSSTFHFYFFFIPKTEYFLVFRHTMLISNFIAL